MLLLASSIIFVNFTLNLVVFFCKCHKAFGKFPFYLWQVALLNIRHKVLISINFTIMRKFGQWFMHFFCAHKKGVRRSGVTEISPASKHLVITSLHLWEVKKSFLPLIQFCELFLSTSIWQFMDCMVLDIYYLAVIHYTDKVANNLAKLNVIKKKFNPFFPHQTFSKTIFESQRGCYSISVLALKIKIF